MTANTSPSLDPDPLQTQGLKMKSFINCFRYYDVFITSRRHVGIRMGRVIPVKMMSKVSGGWSVVVGGDRGAAAPWHLTLDCGGPGCRLQSARGCRVVEEQGVLALEPAGRRRGAVGCQAVLH